MKVEKHYSKAEAARLVGLSVRTLERYHEMIGRPRFVKVGAQRVAVPESEIRALMTGEIGEQARARLVARRDAPAGRRARASR